MQTDNQKLGAALHHLGHAMLIIGDALKEMIDETKPQLKTSTPAPASTTAKAKAKADKEAQTAAEPEAEVETKVEEKPKAEVKAKAKKEKEPAFDFEAVSTEEKIEHLRGLMVKASAALKGDRTKVFAFLKKYQANKVNELSEENLTNLKTDLDIFLGGPEALGV